MHSVNQQPIPTASPDGPVGGDPLSASLQAEQNANPDIASVSSPTKFGRLMRVVQPMVEGAAIGGLTGRSTSGGGFAGANAFYQNQRQQMYQRMMMARQFQNDIFHNSLLQQQAQLDQARTTHELNRPNFTGRSIIPMAAVNSNGQKVFVRANPITGEPEEVQGYTPPDKDVPDSFSDSQTDQGLVTLDRRTGKHTLATLDAPGSDNTSQGATPRTIPGGVPAGMFAGTDTAIGGSGKPPTRFDSGSPVARGAVSTSPNASPSTIAGAVPLRAPGFGKPKPGKVTTRNAAGAETDSLIDENPDSPTFGRPLKSNVASRAPVPDRSADRDAAKTATNARVEQYAGAALAKTGNDPQKAIDYLSKLEISDPAAAKDYAALLPQIRAHIRDRTSVGKVVKKMTPAQLQMQKALGLSPEDMAGAATDDEENQ